MKPGAVQGGQPGASQRETQLHHLFSTDNSTASSKVQEEEVSNRHFRALCLNSVLILKRIVRSLGTLVR